MWAFSSIKLTCGFVRVYVVDAFRFYNRKHNSLDEITENSFSRHRNNKFPCRFEIYVTQFRERTNKQHYKFLYLLVRLCGT